MGKKRTASSTSKKLGKTSSTSKKLGKANSLLGECWKDWLAFVKQHSGPTMYLVLYLTQGLCLRITQAAQLKNEDVDLKRSRVWVAPFKKHTGVFKPIPASVKKTLVKIKTNGLRGNRKTYEWPSRGYLFPASKGNKAHLGKDVLARNIRAVRGPFVKQFARKWLQLSDGKPIRSHSGRRHAISTLSNEGLADTVIMAWSQIDSYRTLRGYIDRNPSAVSNQIKAFDAKCPIG